LIKLGKDKITNENRNNIVYRIPCNDCDCIYIGQSKQKFCKRLYEHGYAIKKRDEKNALAMHVMKTGHTINFEKANIVDTEKKFL